jgi:hypothetical protein
MDRQAAHAALRRILAERQFSHRQTADWRREVLRRVSQWLADVWQHTFGRHIGSQTIASLLMWTLSIAAVIVLIAWIMRTAVRRRRDAPAEIGSIEAAPGAWRDLAREADALLTAGRVREATRVAYRAAVHRLAEEGALRVDDTRTPRENLRQLPRAHRRRTALASLTKVFERVWYGLRPASQADGAEVHALLMELECLPRDRAI